MTKITFQDLNLSESTLKWLEKKWFQNPSPIQEQVIPLLLEDKHNIIGQAETWTGKTAAFGIPLIEKLKSNGKIQALILTPTRELAIQVAEEIDSLQSSQKLKIAAIYGGQSYDIQNRILKRWVDIIVGTPGRIIDHINKKNLNLKDIKYFILDEADEMLNMWFIDDIEIIFKQTNQNKKVLLFSATMPKEILRVAKKYMWDYKLISIQKKQLTTTQTEQFYIQVQERSKLDALCRFMDKEDDFYKTKRHVDEIFTKLQEKWYNTQALHWDIQQKQREWILRLFKNKKVKILVATDVAARWIDVNDITHVINFALPQDPESYVHRIGRTGRAGKTWTAISFVTPSEYKKLVFFQKSTNTNIQKIEIPAASTIIESKKRKLKSNIQDTMDSWDHKKYLDMAKELLQEKDSIHVLAALLEIVYSNEFSEEYYQKIDNFSIFSKSWKTRIFLALGKKAGYHAKTIVEFITQKTWIPSREIDDVRVLDDFSFITVPDEKTTIVLKTFKWMSSKARNPRWENNKQHRRKTNNSKRNYKRK